MTRGAELVDINKSYVSENDSWQLQAHLQRMNHRDTRANLRNYVLSLWKGRRYKETRDSLRPSPCKRGDCHAVFSR